MLGILFGVNTSVKMLGLRNSPVTDHDHWPAIKGDGELAWIESFCHDHRMAMGRVGVKSSKGASAGNRTQRSGYCHEGLNPRGLRIAAERRAGQFTDRYHSQRITGERGWTRRADPKAPTAHGSGGGQSSTRVEGGRQEGSPKTFSGW